MSVAVLVAPLLGGIVLEKGGYAAVFAMAYGLLAADILFRLLLIEKKEAIRWTTHNGAIQRSIGTNPTPAQLPTHSTDAKAKLALSLRIQTAATNKRVSKASIDFHDSVISSPISQVSVASSWSPTAPLPPPPPEPRLPPIITLLGSTRLLFALWGVIVQAALLTAFDSTIPLYVRDMFGWSSVGAGLIFLPLLLPSILNPIIGRLVDRFGPRWFATAGFFFAAPFLVLLRLVDHDSLRQKVLLCALLVFLGVCISLMVGPLMAEVAWIVEEEEHLRPGSFGRNGAFAQAYGLFNTAYAAGCLIGPLWGGMVREHAGWGTMTWTLALLSGVTTVPVMMWSGGSLWKRRRRDCEVESVIEVNGMESTVIQVGLRRER